MSEYRCPNNRHHHPRLEIALHTRTRLVGTLNLAWAVRGKSCGWGTCANPRRTFVGFYRLGRPAYHRAIELFVERDPEGRGMGRRKTLLRVPLGSGVTTWRFSKTSAETPADRQETN